MSPLLPFALMLALSGAPTGEPGPGTIAIVSRTITPPKGQTVRGPWLGTRLGELVRQLEATCYTPALAKKPTAAGDLTLKATFGRNARFSGVTVAAARGATLDSALRTCVRRAVTAARLDMRPLPPIEHDPDLPGAYYDPPMDPPSKKELPIKITLGLRFTAPPLAEQEPAPIVVPPPEDKVCRGPSPAGCRSTGCRPGFVCNTKVQCIPSSCGCNRDSGAWVCTADCGGGMCVPEGFDGKPF